MNVLIYDRSDYERMTIENNANNVILPTLTGVVICNSYSYTGFSRVS